jgi:hypothetical protein
VVQVRLWYLRTWAHIKKYLCGACPTQVVLLPQLSRSSGTLWGLLYAFPISLWCNGALLHHPHVSRIRPSTDVIRVLTWVGMSRGMGVGVCI